METSSVMKVDQMVNHSIIIDAPVSGVWNVLTSPELIKRWMSDEEMEIISDWKEGSLIRVSGKLHGMDFENKGTILQFKLNEILRYTFWSTLSEQPDIPENYSIVTFKLSSRENKTEIMFTQANFIAETTYQHSDFYWRNTLEIVKRLIENR
jgi:uncharacterized protein YndB with AHSA1/START domain